VIWALFATSLIYCRRDRSFLRPRRLLGIGATRRAPDEEASVPFVPAFPRRRDPGALALGFGFFCVRLRDLFRDARWPRPDRVAICFKRKRVTGGEQGMRRSLPSFDLDPRAAVGRRLRTAEYFYFLTLLWSPSVSGRSGASWLASSGAC